MGELNEEELRKALSALSLKMNNIDPVWVQQWVEVFKAAFAEPDADEIKLRLNKGDSAVVLHDTDLRHYRFRKGEAVEIKKIEKRLPSGEIESWVRCPQDSTHGWIPLSALVRKGRP